MNAVLYINPKAAADARSLDDERKRGRPRGPLHGIPILLKDNFDTKDMPTTGGCLALSNNRPKDDAFQVRKLREAGAVILGKVNLHELALGLTTVSSLGGQTLDPYRPDARAGRKQRRFGGRGHREFRRGHARHRHQRLHPHPQFAQQRRRPSAQPGALEPRGHHPVRPHAGHGRTDCA